MVKCQMLLEQQNREVVESHDVLSSLLNFLSYNSYACSVDAGLEKKSDILGSKLHFISDTKRIVYVLCMSVRFSITIFIDTDILS